MNEELDANKVIEVMQEQLRQANYQITLLTVKIRELQEGSIIQEED